MTPTEVFQWVIDLLGSDLQNVLISLIALIVVVAIVYMVQTLRLDRAYDRYKAQLGILAEYAPDVFLRLAFPEVDDEALAKELDRYQQIALDRLESGLSWVDPRMLYAIDRVELALPEKYRIDFNVVLDRMEVIYQKMQEDGVFDGRVDDLLTSGDE